MIFCWFFAIGLIIVNCIFLYKYFKYKKNQIDWYFAKDKLPIDGQEIIAIFSDFVCIGVKDGDKIIFTEFLGMPYYDLKDLRWWCEVSEFKKIRKLYNR
mgnify:CR=1 FL=1